MKKISILIVLFILSTPLLGVSTSFWTDNSIQDFEKGKLDGLSINENGQLYLAPKSTTLLKKDDLFIWDIVKLKDGSIFTATGINGKIYKINKNGESGLFKKLEAMSVTALAVSKNNKLYAATSPNGKLIRMDTAKGNSNKTVEITRFKETYIWDMQFDNNGTLYVVTGNPARLYSVNVNNGAKKLIFSAVNESHFLSLGINSAGSVYFGSAPNGRLYKMSYKSKKVKIHYDTYENEISCIHIDKKGIVYFGTATQYRKYPGENFKFKDSFTFKEKDTKVKKTLRKIKKKKKPLKNSVYKLNLDDKIEKIFTMSGISIFSLVTDKNKNLYIGTGDKGVIYKLDRKNTVSRLTRFHENQILRLIIDKGSLYVGTGNDGSVFKMDLQAKTKGVYTSQVIDCFTKSIWGSISWIGTRPANTKISIYTRTGNTDAPDKSWSKWEGPFTVKSGDKIKSPSARYIQYRIIFSSSRLGNTPMIQSVSIPFLKKNRPPRIKSILLTSYSSLYKPAFSKPSKLKLKPGQMKITWFSADDDNDSLIYSVYFKFKNDSTWYLLRNRFYKNTLIFNTSLLPNSRYTFKITASDLPSNTDLTYKTGSKESRSFLVDHSEPLIKNLKVKHSGNKIIISGITKDEWSIITKLKYTLNVKQWRNINPIDDVYDSKTEKFRIVIDKKANPFLVNGKNILIIRAQDKYANWITEKVVFNVKLNTTDRGFINNNLYFKKHHN